MSMHRQKSEVEEIKEFRKLHRANCCIYILHAAFLGLMISLMIMWQM
jgi:hypothetical protein